MLGRAGEMDRRRGSRSSSPRRTAATSRATPSWRSTRMARCWPTASARSPTWAPMPSTVGIIIQLMIGPWVSTSIYDIRTIDFDFTAVLTNTAPTAAYRGAGRPEAIYLIERLFDTAAHKLGLDPAEIRRRNLIAPEQMPYTNAMGQVYDSGKFGSILEQGLALAKWDDFASARGRRPRRAASCAGAAWPRSSNGPAATCSRSASPSRSPATARSRSTPRPCRWARASPPPTRSLSSMCSACRSSKSASSRATPTAARASAAPARARCSPPGPRSISRRRRRWRTARDLAGGRAGGVGRRHRIRRRRVPRSPAPTGRSACSSSPAQQPEQRIFVDATSTVGGPTWPNGCHICEVEIDPDTGDGRDRLLRLGQRRRPRGQPDDRARPARRRCGAGHRPGARRARCSTTRNRARR